MAARAGWRALRGDTDQGENAAKRQPVGMSGDIGHGQSHGFEVQVHGLILVGPTLWDGSN
jgi:hypothetical protein